MTAATFSAYEVHLQDTGTSQEASNPFGLKCFAIETPATVDYDNTIAITLATYGITTMWDVMCFTHSTTDDIIVTETTEVETSVTTGVLTVTVQGSTGDKKRVIVVWGV